jgi:hypothetical protein
LSTNLLSIGRITEKGNVVIFKKNSCEVLNANGKLIASGTKEDGLYKLDYFDDKCMMVPKQLSKNLWHRRLGHLNNASMKEMKNGVVTGIGFAENDEIQKTCVPCAEGKQHRLKFPKGGKRAEKILDRIHSDLCGPMENESLGGNVH